MARLGVGLLGAGLTLLLGCGHPKADPPSHRASQGPSTATELARVDGVPIDAAEVREIAEAIHLAPAEALQRLIGEQLLSEEAVRRGFDKRPEVVRVGEQAAVQLLLAKEIESRTATEDEIAEAYEAQRARFDQPERRKSLHVLVSIKRAEDDARQSAAERLVRTIVQELSASSEPRAVWERYRSLGTLEGFTIKAEELPPVSRTDAYAPEYVEGLFSRTEPGVVTTPVLTDFGWHAIVVTEIRPHQVITLEQARDTLRKELTGAQRKAALDALIASLRGKHQVVPNQAAIDALLHADLQALGPGAP